MVKICGNDTGSCARSSNYENSTSQDWFHEDTSPRNKPTTKAPEKHLKKETNYRDRLNKRRKFDFLAIAEIRSHAIHVFKKSPNVSRTKATLKTKKVRNGRKKRVTKRVQVLFVPIPIPQISKEDFRNKPDRPHPLEIEKTDQFTSTDLQNDAIISYLSWVFLGSAALSLWAVLLGPYCGHTL